MNGPSRSPRRSSATRTDRVKSGPPAPPAASRPWQKPHCDTNCVRPASAWSRGNDCGVLVCGGRCEAGLASPRPQVSGRVGLELVPRRAVRTARRCISRGARGI